LRFLYPEIFPAGPSLMVAFATALFGTTESALP
jgi:hypothetical protein